MKRGATKEEIIRITQELITRNGIRAPSGWMRSRKRWGSRNAPSMKCSLTRKTW